MKTIVRGRASDDREVFHFTIEDFVTGGFSLVIEFSGDGRSNSTGSGIWPSVEKAKQIAEETASRLLHGASVKWDE
jgi:hypothetical protein